MGNPKKQRKATKIFLKKKNKKGEKRLGTDIKFSLKKKKRKRVNIVRIEIKNFLKKKAKESYMKNYYLALKKKLLGF